MKKKKTFKMSQEKDNNNNDNSKYNLIWKELIADILLIDKVQTYGIHPNANIIAFVIGRSILIVIGIYLNYFIGCTIASRYYGFYAFTFVIIAETIYVSIKKKGVDFKWFSISYLAFTIQSVAGLWIGSYWSHELKDIECITNVTRIEYEKMQSDCKIPSLNSYCTSLSVFLCAFLMTIIFVRRHSPIKVSNETHSLLLISYLTAAADIVDFADYSQNEVVSEGVGIEIIWILVMLSSVQFSFALTAKRYINYANVGFKSFSDFLFGTEVWSICLIIFTLELPYAISRIFFLIRFGLRSDPTLFFLLKV